jgi:anti-sigma B factor antagonist
MDITETNGITLAILKGDFDLYAAPAARESLLARMMSEDHRMLVDMSGVRYLDSSGIGTLIRLIQHSRDKKGRILFAGLQASPLRVLTMSNILPLLAVTDNRDAALKILEKRND